MFPVELELSIYFVPPMEDIGRGISLVNTIELPFPPFEDLCLTGEVFHPYYSSADGFPLKSVTWDVDRKLFLANISLSCQDHPITFIPGELRNWIEAGWRFGSHDDAYEEPEELEEQTEDPNEQTRNVTDTTPWNYDWEDEDNRLPSMSPRSRPKEFNKLLKALVREMALLFNNESVAYAIDRTQQFFTEEELKTRDSKAKMAFVDAMVKFKLMSIEVQLKWNKRVLRTHPKLTRIVTQS